MGFIGRGFGHQLSFGTVVLLLGVLSPAGVLASMSLGDTIERSLEYYF
jgi:hypothetical protein